MTEPTKTRPGDQPLPTAGHECVQDKLIALIEERKQLGIQRYGSPLMTHNGCDAGRDAVEEALDLTVYSMQVAMELRDLRAVIERVRDVAADMRGITGARQWADWLDTALRGMTAAARPKTQGTRCVCGDPIEWWTGPGDSAGWIHRPVMGSIPLTIHQARPAPAGDEEAPLAACRIMVTRTCPQSYNGPCGDRPCARFESVDPRPWLDTAKAPATCNEPGPWEDSHACVLSAGHPDDHQAHDGCGWRTGRCGSGQHKPHPGFTCAEVEQSRPFWEGRWGEADQEQTPAADEAPASIMTMTDEEALRSNRRDSLLNLLARLQRGGMRAEEIVLLRQHVETEIREADTAREQARKAREETALDMGRDLLRDGLDAFLMRLVGSDNTARILGERDQAQAAIERVRNYLAELERAGWSQAAIARRIRAALDGAEQPTTAEDDEGLRAKLDKATATLRRVRAVTQAWEPRLLPRSEAHRLFVEVRNALAGPRPDADEQPATEKPTTCTATITDSLGSEALIRCVEPAGHYDEDQRPEFPEGKQEPRGWHTDREGRVWSDRATTATPHGAQPATEA